jgi:peptide/nickel transport system substrate-binding protein
MRMNRRDNAVVVVLVLALVVLGGALAIPASRPDQAAVAGTPPPSLPPPVTYREAVVGVPQSITPVTARNRAERTLVGLVFSGLMRMGPDLTLQGDLARSWEMSADGKDWTFTIRDDATWHDGTPVTAADVVYTVDALKSPEAAGALSAAWAEVTVEALDERTVRFSLATPIGGFLAAATQPLLPAHLLGDVPFAELAESDFARLPVGTGPYALTEIDERGALLLPASVVEPSPEPSLELPSLSPDALATPGPEPTPVGLDPYIDRIEVLFYSDDAAATAAIQSGAVDAVAGLGTDHANVVAAEEGIDRLLYPTTTLSTVIINLRPSHPELRDPRVRRALLAGLDREALVGNVLGGEGVPAYALVPPSSWAYDGTAAAPILHDPAVAKKLLEEAGWTTVDGAWAAPGKKTPYELELLAIPASANPRLAAIAGFVRDAWTDLGFKVQLVERPATDIAAGLRDGTFTAAVLDIMMGVEPDLYPLLASTQVRAAGSNLSGYQDTELDALLEAARAPADTAARRASWKALLAGIASRNPMLPLAWDQESMFARDLEGVTPTLIADTGDRYWDVLAWRLAADR